MEAKISHKIEITEDGSIIIKDWKQVARAFRIPKSSKRVQVKRLKKCIQETLILAMEKHDE